MIGSIVGDLNSAGNRVSMGSVSLARSWGTSAIVINMVAPRTTIIDRVPAASAAQAILLSDSHKSTISPGAIVIAEGVGGLIG